MGRRFLSLTTALRLRVAVAASPQYIAASRLRVQRVQKVVVGACGASFDKTLKPS